MTVSSDGLKPLLLAASALQMGGLTATLEEHIRRLAAKGPPGQLLSLFEIAYSKTCPRLFSYSTRQFLLARTAAQFGRFSPTELSRIDLDAVVSLLADDRLDAADDELKVFRVVLTWLETNVADNDNDGAEGKEREERLLDCVRFALLTTQQKFDCLDLAGRLEGKTLPTGLSSMVKRRLCEADWFKTCHEAGKSQLCPVSTCPRRGGNWPKNENRALHGAGGLVIDNEDGRFFAKVPDDNVDAADEEEGEPQQRHQDRFVASDEVAASVLEDLKPMKGCFGVGEGRAVLRLARRVELSQPFLVGERTFQQREDLRVGTEGKRRVGELALDHLEDQHREWN